MKDRLGQLLYRKRMRVIRPYIFGRLLDIGCGLNFLVREYGNGVGVDVYDWGDVDVLVDNSAHLDFTDESFDTITCLAALNHIPNRSDVLSECFRLLKPGGILLMTMISPGVSRVWHALRSPWDHDQTDRGMKKGEVYGISHEDMKRLISEAGFQLKDVKYFMAGMNRLYVVTKG